MEQALILIYIWGFLGLLLFADGWKAHQLILWPLEIIKRWWRD